MRLDSAPQERPPDPQEMRETADMHLVSGVAAPAPKTSEISTEALPSATHLLSDNDPLLFFSGTIIPLLKQDSFDSRVTLERFCANVTDRGQIMEALSRGAILSIDEGSERLQLLDILKDYWRQDYTNKPGIFVEVCNDV